jgi:hypothetical protein
MRDNSVTLIITGMHRSGTSLVASMFHQAGVYLGHEFIAPDHGNPRGHFEDVEFINLHKKILNRWGYDILVQAAELGAVIPDDIREAQILIKQRGDSVWGWKDPRTSLFLDFWHDLLPHANYLFIYRHPLEVVLSLLRRGVDLEALVEPIFALQTWQVYNQAIWNYYQQHSEKCLLCNISGIVAHPDDWAAQVADRFGITLSADELYQPRELHQKSVPHEAMELLREIAPDVVNLYEQFEHQADIAGPANVVSSEAESFKLLADNSLTSLLTKLDPETMRCRPAKSRHVINEWRQRTVWQHQRITQLEQAQLQLQEEISQLDINLSKQLQLVSILGSQIQAMKMTKGWRFLERFWTARERLTKLIGKKSTL